MTHDNTTEDHLTANEIREKAEQFLNFKFSNRSVDWYGISKDRGFYDIQVKIKAGRNREETHYQLQACPVCGEIQPMNFSALKKSNPSDAEMILEEIKEEQIQKYRDSGIQPKTEERLKEKIETSLLHWDNNRCETRHPPVRDRPAYHGNDPQTNRMY